MTIEQGKSTGQDVHVVVFKLGTEEYAVDILQVQEIKRIVDITRVPHAPDYVEGVMNLRGSILPVVDLKKLLHLPPEPPTETTRIVIAKIDNVTVGMIVDAVVEVVRLPAEKVDPAPGGEMKGDYDAISGVGKWQNRLLIILDLPVLLKLKMSVAETI